VGRHTRCREREAPRTDRTIRKSSVVQVHCCHGQPQCGQPPPGRKGYYRHSLANELAAATGRIGLKYLETDWTWCSTGKFLDGNKKEAYHTSCLDHAYVTGIFAAVKVLNNATCDHRPVVFAIKAGNISSSNSNSK
jgi:hypothetical protein